MGNETIKTKLCTEGVIEVSPEEKEFMEKFMSLGENNIPYNPVHDNQEPDYTNGNIFN
mgnify:CR=1 FL=1